LIWIYIPAPSILWGGTLLFLRQCLIAMADLYQQANPLTCVFNLPLAIAHGVLSDNMFQFFAACYS
jgi:hypothetical protein